MSWAAAKRILEHDAAATPGPWELEHFEVPGASYIAHGAVKITAAADENAALIAAFRSDAPVVAGAYQEAIELLRQLSEWDALNIDPPKWPWGDWPSRWKAEVNRVLAAATAVDQDCPFDARSARLTDRREWLGAQRSTLSANTSPFSGRTSGP